MMKFARNIVLVVMLSTSSIAMAQESGWRISEADGQISVIRDGKALYGAEGTALQIGDVVQASKGGRAVLVRGDDVAILSPNGQIRIVKQAKKGAVAHAMDFIEDLFETKDEDTRYRPVQAAVVKGYDKTSQVDTTVLNTLNGNTPD